MTNRRLSRRHALGAIGAATALGATSSVGCKRSEPPPAPPLEGALHGNQVDVGHRIRRGNLPTASSTVERDVLIVGGGVAGLSAAWRLAGLADVEVLEMAPTVGGTARAGGEGAAVFPWGAHYLPVPNPESRAVLRLCREMGLATGPADAPIFDERHLVHDPEDRIFFRGRWVPGLYLTPGATDEDLRQRAAFDAFVRQLRDATGSDDRPAFAIPEALSSRDPEFLRYDAMTMAALLDQKGWTSERLRWTVDYACRDDYGAPAADVSAWAGLHYFCARRPLSTGSAEGTRYFTWPDGNARIVRWLSDRASVRTGAAAFRVTSGGEVDVWDVAAQKTVRYRARHVILATPGHVTQAITGGARKKFADHAPWAVVNLRLDGAPDGPPPAWNNVLVDSPSQGYVPTQHQSLDRSRTTGHDSKPIWTWYRAYPAAGRGALLTADWKGLANAAIKDLRRAHPDLPQRVRRAEVWRWGHGTIVPRPGTATGDRLAAAKPWGSVHFAHTDLSGLPLFEEAQYHGLRAAEAILALRGDTGETWL